MDISSAELEQALIRLVDVYETDLPRLCYVILGDRHFAQDAVQETFFKAYRSLNRFRGDCSEKTWITRIAVNTCRDIRRQRWFHLHAQSMPYENLHLTDKRCKQELTLEETALALRISRHPRIPE